MHKKWMVCALFLATSIALAQRPGQILKTGQAYFDLYNAQNAEGLRPFLTDDSVFRDPSMEAKGAEEIISKLAKVFAEDIGEMNFEVEARFVSGRSAVFRGTVTFTMNGKLFQQPEQTFKFSVPFVVTLAIRGEKVLEHVDYVDSYAFSTQLRQQMKQTP